MTPLLNTLLALEDRLLAGDFNALLHPDFLEFGQSGKRWTRGDVLQTLSPSDGPSHRGDVQLQALSDSLALLTWKSQARDRPSTWRSSLWQLDAAHGWRLRFHQATPIPGR